MKDQVYIVCERSQTWMSSSSRFYHITTSADVEVALRNLRAGAPWYRPLYLLRVK